MATGKDLKIATPVSVLVGDERIRIEQEDAERMVTPDQLAAFAQAAVAADPEMPELDAAPVDAVAATGTLTSDNTNVANNAPVTIGAKTYTFKTALTPLEGEILIGVDADASLTNLVSAIMHTGTPGTDYSAAAVHPTVTAAAVASHATALTAKTKGAAGNAIVTTETSIHLAFGAATLTGGIDGTPGTQNHFGAFEGQPYFCTADATVATSGAWKKIELDPLEEEGGGGGGSALGVSRVIGPFVVSYNDAGLLAGKLLGYTPTDGDLLIEAWVRGITNWDQAARLDIGLFTDGEPGIFESVNATLKLENMNSTDGTTTAPHGVSTTSGDNSTPGTLSLSAKINAYQMPFEFQGSGPLKVKVDDGSGSDPGATQGQVRIYLLVATPTVP